MAKLVITTIHRPAPEISEQGQYWADRLQIPFVTRDSYSLQAIQDAYHAELVVVVTHNGPIVHTAGGKFFFHLNMAELRIKRIRNGNHDHMVAAMKLDAGMSVLDCTLGLGTDAIVAGFVTGSNGRVQGIEVSPIIAFVISHGLQSFSHTEPDITAALRRVTVKHADYSDYLQTLSDDSFDIVYFDPMFRIPLQDSSQLKPIRFLAEHRPLSKSILQEAVRVARKRVVIKETRNSPEFRRLGITYITGGKYSSIQYGSISASAEGAGWIS